MPNGGWPIVRRDWVLVCYHGNGGTPKRFSGQSQTHIYEKMCSSSFINGLLRRGYTDWEMYQEAPHVV